MGATLDYVLTSLALPVNSPPALVSGLYKGMQALLNLLGEGAIVGGDTVGSPTLMLSHSVVGHLPPLHQAGFRHMAMAGDILLATGFHGLSAVGLWALQQPEHLQSSLSSSFTTAKARHLRPVPRLKEAQAVAASGVRYALMDTSDGLADAALKLAKASDVRLLLHKEALAIHPDLRSYQQETQTSFWEPLLYGGEDFELLMSMAPSDWQRLKQADLTGWTAAWQVVGNVQAGPQDAWLASEAGQLLQALDEQATFQHFALPELATVAEVWETEEADTLNGR
jgi:thiamine-monophosphate kinase